MNGFSHEEIEQATISALMQWPEQCWPILESYRLSEDHFQNPNNKILFNEAKSLWKSGKRIDLISFTDTLRTRSKLAAAGGAAYLTQTWCNTCHSPIALSYYCDILQSVFATKSLMKICTKTAELADTTGNEPEQLISDTERELAAIPIKPPAKEHKTFAELVAEKMERMESGKISDDIILTGITKLDEASPLRRGDMPLIAGERKSGKSVLALTIILNIARNGIGCLYFSLEDRKPKVIDRLFAGVSRIPFNQHYSERWTETGMIEKALKAHESLSKLPIEIRDDCCDLSEIEAVTREIKSRNDIGLVVVDYGQLVRVPDKKDVNREQTVAQVSRHLRLLAMELNTPIIVLSQLNSEGFTRESRSLEQDSTAMWLITTEEDEPSKRWLQIPFQRNGRSGVRFPVTFLGEIARVENYERPSI